MQTLASFAHDSSRPERQDFAARIVRNVGQHPVNRTPIYKQELRVTVRAWRDDVFATTRRKKSLTAVPARFSAGAWSASTARASHASHAFRQMNPLEASTLQAPPSS